MSVTAHNGEPEVTQRITITYNQKNKVFQVLFESDAGILDCQVNNKCIALGSSYCLDSQSPSLIKAGQTRLLFMPQDSNLSSNILLEQHEQQHSDEGAGHKDDKSSMKNLLSMFAQQMVPLLPVKKDAPLQQEATLVSQQAAAEVSATPITPTPSTPLVLPQSNNSPSHHSSSNSSKQSKQKNKKEKEIDASSIKDDNVSLDMPNTYETYVRMISLCLQEQDQQRASLQVIYNWLQEKYPQLKVFKRDWRALVRTYITRCSNFVRVPGKYKPAVYSLSSTVRKDSQTPGGAVQQVVLPPLPPQQKPKRKKSSNAKYVEDDTEDDGDEDEEDYDDEEEDNDDTGDFSLEEQQPPAKKQKKEPVSNNNGHPKKQAAASSSPEEQLLAHILQKISADR